MQHVPNAILFAFIFSLRVIISLFETLFRKLPKWK